VHFPACQEDRGISGSVSGPLEGRIWIRPSMVGCNGFKTRSRSDFKHKQLIYLLPSENISCSKSMYCLYDVGTGT
jgi:hypothetical protein